VQIRRFEKDTIVDKVIRVTSVAVALDAHTQWAEFTRIFADEIEIVFSNVGDIGYRMDPEDETSRRERRPAPSSLETSSTGRRRVRGRRTKCLRRSFIQFQPHSVSAAWAKGIQEVLAIQPNTTFQLLDGEAKVDVQISLMDTTINYGANVILFSPWQRRFGSLYKEGREGRRPRHHTQQRFDG
jgi:hypothetical protein